MTLYVAIAIAGIIYKMNLKTNFNKVIAVTLFIFLSMFTSQASQIHYQVPELPKISQLSANDIKQIGCMAKNIFYEAGHETVHGQAAVAQVVLNRIRHGFGRNACAVVYQKTTTSDKTFCQFSWVCEEKGEPNKNNWRYKQAEKVAFDVMILGKYKDVLPKSALFFHSIQIDPLWPYKQVATIGGHVFYSRTKK